MIPYRLVGTGLAILLVVAAGYFAVRTYRSTVAENATLHAQVSNLQATNNSLQAQQAAVAGVVDRNAQQSTQVIEHTRTIERQINAQPVTTNCAQSPAIRVMLDGLRDDQQPSATDDQLSR